MVRAEWRDRRNEMRKKPLPVANLRAYREVAGLVGLQVGEPLLSTQQVEQVSPTSARHLSGTDWPGRPMRGEEGQI